MRKTFYVNLLKIVNAPPFSFFGILCFTSLSLGHVYHHYLVDSVNKRYILIICISSEHVIIYFLNIQLCLFKLTL